MKISLIVAMSVNRVIGRDNQLPWRLSADLRRFKSLTMGHALLMGRKTFESIGRTLPGRTIAVVTRQPHFSYPGVLVAHSIDEALSKIEGDEVFVAGGAQLYQQMLPCADRLYLTLIEREVQGDTFFPEFVESKWEVMSEEHHQADEKNEYPYSFQVYKRRGQKKANQE